MLFFDFWTNKTMLYLTPCDLQHYLVLLNWGAHHLLSFSYIFVAFKSYDLNLGTKAPLHGGFQKDFYLRMKSFSWSRSADRRRKGAWLLCLFDVLPSSNHRADGGKESLDVSVGFPFLVEAFVPSTLGSDLQSKIAAKPETSTAFIATPEKMLKRYQIQFQSEKCYIFLHVFVRPFRPVFLQVNLWDRWTQFHDKNQPALSQRWPGSLGP